MVYFNYCYTEWFVFSEWSWVWIWTRNSAV